MLKDDESKETQRDKKSMPKEEMGGISKETIKGLVRSRGEKGEEEDDE